MNWRPSLGKIIVGIVLFSWGAPAGMIVSDLTKYEFTDPKKAPQIANWDREDVLNISENGLGWNGSASHSYDLELLLQPIAIGHGWRPAGNASVIVDLQFAEEVKNYFWVYVRFSSNGKKWSTWQPAPQVRTEKDAVQTTDFQYSTQISVPRREMKRYLEKQREYQKLDVPWGSDDHALCEWIVENEPTFFEENLPFAGFIQVYIEGSLHGKDRLKSVNVNHTTSTSGIHQPPKDPEMQKKREGSWSYWTVEKADESPTCGFHLPLGR